MSTEMCPASRPSRPSPSQKDRKTISTVFRRRPSLPLGTITTTPWRRLPRIRPSSMAIVLVIATHIARDPQAEALYCHTTAPHPRQPYPTRTSTTSNNRVTIRIPLPQGPHSRTAAFGEGLGRTRSSTTMTSRHATRATANTPRTPRLSTAIAAVALIPRWDIPSTSCPIIYGKLSGS
jgi:hypothetical protein